jgi:hypothetical protein
MRINKVIRKIGTDMARVVEFFALLTLFASIVFIAYGAGGWPGLTIQ